MATDSYSSLLYTPAILAVTGTVSSVDLRAGTFMLVVKQKCHLRPQRVFQIRVYMNSKEGCMCPRRLPDLKSIVSLRGEMYSITDGLFDVSVEDFT